MVTNTAYDELFVTVQRRFIMPHPVTGQDVVFYDQSQYKWLMKTNALSPTGCKDCVQEQIMYLVDRRAHCKTQYLLKDGVGIWIPASHLIETIELINPPVFESIEDNLNGNNIEMWLPPGMRAYNPKWHGSRDGTGGADDATAFCC